MPVVLILPVLFKKNLCEVPFKILLGLGDIMLPGESPRGHNLIVITQCRLNFYRCENKFIWVSHSTFIVDSSTQTLELGPCELFDLALVNAGSNRPYIVANNFILYSYCYLFVQILYKNCNNS